MLAMFRSPFAVPGSSLGRAASCSAHVSADFRQAHRPGKRRRRRHARLKPALQLHLGGRPASTRNQSGSDTRSDAGTSARSVPTQPRTHRAAEQPADGEFPASVCTADDVLLSQVPVALVMQRAPVALDPEVASDGAGATTVGVTVTLPAIPIPW